MFLYKISQIRYFMNKALVLFLTCRMAKKGPSADVDKASNTESERNIHQGSNRGRLGVFFFFAISHYCIFKFTY